MKYILIKSVMVSMIAMAILASCDDKLDITPKGQSTLSTVDDLEMLLNNNINLGMPNQDIAIVCNESYGQGDNIPVVLGQKSTVQYALVAYDETVDRASLTLNDDRYNAAYRHINYMNTIIEKMPDATGDETKKNRLVAEAHIMRAYLHWLLVNIYAKQYDEATAAKDGGIAYVTDLNVTETKRKLTVAEVYENILADCSDEYIISLPVKTDDVLRADQAWGNAVRAKVLMQMKRYAEALPYAERALQINGNIDDRASVVEQYDWILKQQSPSNYVYFGGMVAPFSEVISPETALLFEQGDYVKDYAFFMGMKPEGGGDGDYEDNEDWEDDEDWSLRANRLKAADDEDGGDEEDWYAPANADNPAWNALFGMLQSGVVGSSQYFGFGAYVNTYGITSDRMYYTAAECLIRTGKIEEGMAYVNKVRQYRIHPDYFVELTAETETEAMEALRNAKWIECICTYENFFDCKRWNSEVEYRRDISRTIMDMEGNSNTYTITPDSKLWIMPFPQNVVRKNPSLTPNI